MLASDFQFESFYNEHFDRLTRLAVTDFHLSDDQAADLVHDILLASILQLPRIVDAKVWLAGALTFAVRKGATHA